MNITKSMIYNPTTESRELYLCTVNNGDAYRDIMHVVANLAKKYARGIFDATQATAAFFHVTTAEAKRYAHSFGYAFDVTERWTAAADVLADYMDEIRENANA